MTQVLVVSNDIVGLANTLCLLRNAGYHASGASTFQEARRSLASGSPDLVIADERLGEFNGLHVILLARAEHPELSAIVTTAALDRGLEADAKSLDVLCVLKPTNPTGWLPLIATALARHRVVLSPTVSRSAYSTNGVVPRSSIPT
jgi:DNA-binding NtrC family response regulator